MSAAGRNYKWIMCIHLVVIGAALVMCAFFNQDFKKVSLIVLGAAVLSLLIQAFVHEARPGWYGDEVAKHPHEA